MKKIHTIETRNAETGEVLSRSKINTRGKVVAGVLAVSTMFGTGYGIDRAEDYFKHKKHVSTEYHDFSKYNLAGNPEELAKIYEKEGISPNDLEFYTVKGEQNAEEVAKAMGIYNWAEVGDSIISAQVNDPESKARWTMHPGQIVVVPKDLFDK